MKLERIKVFNSHNISYTDAAMGNTKQMKYLGLKVGCVERRFHLRQLWNLNQPLEILQVT